MLDDALRQPRADPRYPRQQRSRGDVGIDSDRVDAILHHRIERARQFALAKVMLICPTPMAFGSILTSSASGSCSRRAIDTAPRNVTSSSGNSSDAKADAE